MMRTFCTFNIDLIAAYRCRQAASVSQSCHSFVQFFFSSHYAIRLLITSNNLSNVSKKINVFNVRRIISNCLQLFLLRNSLSKYQKARDILAKRKVIERCWHSGRIRWVTRMQIENQSPFFNVTKFGCLHSTDLRNKCSLKSLQCSQISINSHRKSQ